MASYSIPFVLSVVGLSRFCYRAGTVLLWFFGYFASKGVLSSILQWTQKTINISGLHLRHQQKTLNTVALYTCRANNEEMFNREIAK